MRALKNFLPIFAAIFLSGCAGYHLGSVNGDVAGEKTVEVQPFNNQTLQPRLGDAVTQALRERLQTDGTYRLVTGEPGDLVISGIIRNYSRVGLGNLNQDSSTMQNIASASPSTSPSATASPANCGSTAMCKATRSSTCSPILRVPSGRRRRCWRRIWRKTSPSF
jgi:hypothetical protein